MAGFTNEAVVTVAKSEAAGIEVARAAAREKERQR